MKFQEDGGQINWVQYLNEAANYKKVQDCRQELEAEWYEMWQMDCPSCTHWVYCIFICTPAHNLPELEVPLRLRADWERAS